MATWLKECEICNEGLCNEMSYLTDSVEKGGVGLSVREAAKRLEGHAVEQVGEKIWTAEQIRARYLYHTGQVKSGRISTTPTKPAPLPVATKDSGIDQADQETMKFMDVADQVVTNIDQALYINKLERSVASLPANPPTNWSDDGFKQAQGYARILTKRLAVLAGDNEPAMPDSDLFSFLDQVIMKIAALPLIKNSVDLGATSMVKLKGAKRKSRSEAEPPRALTPEEQENWTLYFKARRANWMCHVLCNHLQDLLPPEEQAKKGGEDQETLKH